MAKESKDFVYHNGLYFTVEEMILQAKNAGEYSLAQPYIVPLLYHANRYHLSYINDEVDKIWKHYNIAPYPSAGVPASSNNMPNYEENTKPADLARKIYGEMTKDQQKAVLKEALTKLRFNNEKLFNNKSCWIGVYLVVKDRLDEKINQSNFYNLGVSITPDNWPDKVRIEKTTMSNFTRKIEDVKDRETAYYEMTNNPYEDLCERFWNILLPLILTKKLG